MPDPVETTASRAEPVLVRLLHRWFAPLLSRFDSRSEREVVLVGLIAMVVTSGLFIYGSYATHGVAKADWAERLSSLSTALAEHAGQTLGSGHTALNALTAVVQAQDFDDAAAYEAWARQPEQQRVLVATQRANPFINVATFVAHDGTVLSFSRSHPAPPISLAERSYFKTHAARDDQAVVTSEPLTNKGDGKLLFYLSRRVNDTHGRFLGVVLVGISIDTFTQVYEKLGRNLGEGAAISLYRDDFMLMVRWPPVPGTLGKQNLQGATHQVIAVEGKSSGTIFTEAKSLIREIELPRLAAPRRVPGYPFIVTPLVTSDVYLRRWVFGAQLTFIVWLCTSALVLGITYYLLKSARRAARLRLERGAAQEALRRSAAELEERVAQRTEALSAEIATREAREQELAALNAEIVTMSHRAGMAEVANSVLHNVGNVLNSLNTSSTVMAERLRQTPLGDLPQAAEMVRQVLQSPQTSVADPARAAQLADFMPLLAAHWREERQLMQREAAALQLQVDHIRDIVSRQQSMTGHSGLIEHFVPADTVAEAVQMHQGALTRQGILLHWVAVDREAWHGDRGKFTQICLNLISNAEQAMATTPADQRHLALSCRVRADGQLRVDVSDSGMGIAPDVLARLFSYGFTTKPNGHGLGLHASALAAQSMGGSLEVFSGGPGQGATFTLTLPSSLDIQTPESP